MSTQDVAGFAAIAAGFDALLLDQFGVLHDGVQPYADAPACLAKLRAAGKRLVVLSNSGRRASDNARNMARLGLPVELFDAVITSGEVAWHALRLRNDPLHAALGRRCLLVAGPRDVAFADGLDLTLVRDVADADFILLVTMPESAQSIEAYEPLLAAGAHRGLPLLCANNDVMRPAGAVLLPAPGALARRYAELGGRVHGYGKPLRPIFDSGLAHLPGIARDRVMMVGDSLAHDIAGAAGAGLRSVYIRRGVGSAGRLRTKVQGLDAVAPAGTAHGPEEPTYAMQQFRW
jgi:HAD superfamily hydrolase (TIGR01459 family)